MATGAAGRRVTAPLLVGAMALAVGQRPERAGGAAIPVRFTEGAVHGFLELRTAQREFLASGDLLQRVDDGLLESRMVFAFPDSSLFDESVSFSQRGVFTMQRYHLVQRGPAFERDIDALLDRASGTYQVTSRSRDGATRTWQGTLELPPDVYNGMVITVAKNLPARDTETIHVVAFTPRPRLVGLELAPDGSQRLTLGARREAAVRYVFKPRLGALVGAFARLTGQYPADSHTWILKEDVPAFVRFQGPLYSGPSWRIDAISPRWTSR